MKFKKNKLLIGLVLILTLGVAFWYGGNAPGLKGFSSKADQETEEVKDVKELEEVKKLTEDSQEEDMKEAEEIEKKVAEANREIKEKLADNESKEEEENSPKKEEKPSSKTEKKARENVKEKGSKKYSNENGMEINSETGKDQYETDPVPEEKPVPVEPENNPVTDEKKYARLSVSVKTLLGKEDWLPKNKVDLVPADGIIYPNQKVEFFEGENVFDLLQREMKNEKIHMEFSNNPMYNSAYVEGINNLYEFDGGELSGWMYKVNNWFPNYGASRYSLKDGDQVDWVYTLDLGKDLGGSSAAGGN